MAVALGAATRHLTADDPSAALLFDTASRYLMYHSLALLGVAALDQPGGARLLRIAGGLFVAGMIAFAGGLVGLALTGSKLLGASIPVGGTLFMLGWLALAGYGMRARK